MMNRQIKPNRATPATGVFRGCFGVPDPSESEKCGLLAATVIETLIDEYFAD